MHHLNRFDLRQRRCFKCEVAVSFEHLAKHPVFRNRKPMLRRQRQNQVVGIEEPSSHEGESPTSTISHFGFASPASIPELVAHFANATPAFRSGSSQSGYPQVTVVS